MHRFFVEPSFLKHAAAGTTLRLQEKLSHQVKTVLHLAIGEQLVLLDNSGDEWLCSVTVSSKTRVEVEVVERRAGRPEPSQRIVLCQGMLKSASSFEWILEKGTELGVSAFIPMLCHRSQSGLERAGASKIRRWHYIIQEAAEQCRRSRMPELLPIRTLEQTLKDIPSEALIVMPWEDEHSRHMRDVLRPVAESMHRIGPRPIFVFIGPEGGLTEEEVTVAQQHNAKIVTLGHNILRAETAAIVAVATIMYEFEGVLVG